MGCATGVGESPNEEGVSSAQSALTGSGSLSITSDWGSGYCASVSLSNGLSAATARWQAIVDLKSTSITGLWGANKSASTGKATFTPVDYNTSVAPGSSTSFTFCANASNSDRPVLMAWNMESNAYASCPTNSGVLPTKAALAVSAAIELGRWDPLNDFTLVTKWVGSQWGQVLALSSTGLARCSNGCPNTQAILGQQDYSISSFMPNTVFDPQMLRNDLIASQQRQANKIDDLKRNNPSQLPPAHKLTLLAGPTNLGIGACGPHYVFQADNLDGTALSSTQAASLGNALCFNGYGSCGANAYVNFVQVSGGCPSGRTCVAIDPTDGDNGSSSTTSAGSAPTYPMNRTYDPTNSLLGTACITSTNKLGTMTSKCSTSPTTCGYLYCIANP